MTSDSYVKGFRATIEIIGVNPYVRVPDAQLRALFKAAGRDKGPIPIALEIGGRAFKQNLVRYQGAWRLYLNTPMRRAAGKDVGDRIAIALAFDPAPRVERMPKELARALEADPLACDTFAALTPSRKKEIQRYLNGLKTQDSLDRNVATVLRHLRGERAATLVGLMRKKRGP